MAGYTVWGHHTKVRRWTAIEQGLSADAATASILTRQERVKITGEPVRFMVLPDDQFPDDETEPETGGSRP